MAIKKHGSKKKPYVAPKTKLMRDTRDEEIALPKKRKGRFKKKTRVQHMFKKGDPHGSRPY